MFENIGRTIKIIAKIEWWIGTITIIGILLIWPSAFVLYGLGELIEKTVEIPKYTKKSIQEEKVTISKNNKKSSQEDILELQTPESLYYDPENIAKENECPSCFYEISKNDTECPNCGYLLK